MIPTEGAAESFTGYAEPSEDLSISLPKNFVQKVSIKHNKNANTYSFWAALFEEAEKATLRNQLIKA